MMSCFNKFSWEWLYHIFISGTILRRWKRNWFDLWANGRLVFYNDQQRRDMEDDIHMRVDCINIRNSSACRGIHQHCTVIPQSRKPSFATFLKVLPLLFVLRFYFSELNPPEGKMRDALLQIVCRDGRVISLCADSADDAL